ncbi:LysM domain/BON superfamily protein [Nocardioides dokdonensis FR1436]|jgi:nucleoid-associated protein YgaU|uniref:LysM domain/BON superfamily protein n=1 Tax=Nocardioides dokdonensis FR1436 TaxID=1300347 RepID=A0A1A9GN74_9ACTN|nr:LysM peptidoglycan-binding domain-containing protein [Nocardioides dokdonensis]ANH39536.1 LysM domain/BON superfamily protein [Nocardioides dokdonensis FR1436]
MTTLGQRIRGLFACLALLGLVVAFPAVLIAIGFAPWDPDPGELRRMLARPDDGSLAFAAFATVGWGAWAVVTGPVLLAAVSEVRRVPVPALPGLAMPQQFAAQLVGAAALLFVAGPTIVAALPSPPAHAVAAVAPESPNWMGADAVPAASAPPASDETNLNSENPQTRPYTVARGDSLWRIAERLFGDGARFTELVDLNRDVLNGRPDFITPGTVLRVPIVESRESETVVVQPGDTLSEIAEQELGDGARYPEIFEASRATAQPDGAHLEDPDLIRPGWELTIPQTADPAQPHDDEATVAPPPTTEPPLAEQPEVEVPTPQAEPTQPAAELATPVGNADDPAAEGPPAWLLPGVAGGGLLAGAVLLAVRAHRRTQLRYRRPGQTLAPNPPELIKVDKTATAYGDRSAYDIEGLDAALNNIAAQSRDMDTPLPALTSVSLSRGVATFHFAERVELSAPWKGEEQRWQVELRTVVVDDDVLSPYPMLVSVGRDDGGVLWLVNLEPLGSIALTGDGDHALAFARHAAAELALNPWSVLVQTDTFGIGEELGDLDTLRLRTHDTDDAAVRSVTAEIQTASRRQGDEPDPWQVVIATNVDLAAVIDDARAQSIGRFGVAVVTVAAAPPEDTAVFEFTPAGRLTTPTIGIDVAAAGLTAEEATLCAAIVDVTRVTPTTDIPNFAQAADGWRSVTDQAGALRTEFTRPRLVGATGSTSLLPEPTDAYVDVAAATEDDINELAPNAIDEAAEALADLDPTLDEDVAAWFDDDSRLPRLTLLGPVRVAAHGKLVEQIVKRRPYYSELLAFVALHPEGVMSRTIAEAFHIGQPRARTDVGHLREWLGKDPRTGEWHIPKQGDHPETEWHGYQVDDLLVDVDLFRRLRARGQARGADGIADLVQALHLVSGKPFDQLRDQGWSWLLDGERLQDLIPCAIVDTAHIVVLDALQRNDLSLARESAEIACTAAPYDEVSRLDLAKVLEAQGHVGAAEETLREDIFDRRDDYEPPVDLPTRTKEIVKNNGWGQRRISPTPKSPRRPAS